MSIEAVHPTLADLAAFAAGAAPPADARSRAARAFLDTIGVALAGASEPASRAVQRTVCLGDGPHKVIGTSLAARAGDAALANGTAAHALDFDDMCFVSLAHPSAPLVPALLAAGEIAAASGAALADAYVIGFEIEARLGRTMNPRHYQRGWHCTSTLGVIGAAAAASRVLGLDTARTAHAIAIAASAASGLKENFGTMAKPLHAGLAARDGVLAACLAAEGLTASARALDGPQGLLRAMDSERADLHVETADLGTRWEIIDTGITVKLYPSCAATHPPLDALLDLRRRERFTAADVDRVRVEVDAITPTVLIYDRPTSGLQAKFSLQYCAAAAVIDGRVGVDTFDDTRVNTPEFQAWLPRVETSVGEALGAAAPPLTEARVHVHLHGGRVLTAEAHGARGYPERPASDAELADKFLSCARRALDPRRADEALARLSRFDAIDDIRAVMPLLAAEAVEGARSQG